MHRRLLHYDIIREIGRGGMGVVYEARDTRLGRSVAIKILPPDKVSDPARKQRFVHEAKAASALNHPNIVTVHDINSDDEVDFIVMEHIDGRTLAELIPARGLRAPVAVKYAVQIADGLAKAHGAGLLHRDLKPSNLMVTDEGRVKVLDFGLAKLLERPDSSPNDRTVSAQALTDEGTMVGTTPYMSPEQAEGNKLDPRSDIFSFGSVLHEMLTGERPFSGNSHLATMAKIVSENPKPVSEIVPSVPPDLAKIVARCLRKDPARRYQYMADVKVALEDVEEESGSGPQVIAKNGIYYVEQRAGHEYSPHVIGMSGRPIWQPTGQLRFYDYRSARISTVSGLGDGVALGLSVSPDGHTVLFSRSDSPTSDLMMIENFR